MGSKLAAAPEVEPTEPRSVDLPPELDRYLPSALLDRLQATPLKRRDWLNATNHLRSIRYLIGTYLPGHLTEKKIHDPRAGEVEAEVLEGSLLFSDVSGFTALSERLADQGQEGTEQLTHALNRYFDAMLDVLARSGGTLLKFAGDALLAYFPAYREGQQAQWAVRAAQRMMLGMQALQQDAAMALRMKVGISTGAFAALSVGSARRMEYVVLGDAVARTLGAEGVASAGEIVVDAATVAQLPQADQARPREGYHVIPPDPRADQDDFEIRATGRRRHTSQILVFDRAEMVQELNRLLTQIQALSPYLSPELVDRIIAGFQQRRIESEFRPTTVLFANVWGFEGLIAGERLLAPSRLARVRDAFDAYFNAMQAIIRRYGGVITRIDPYSRGSKMLVLFGAPVAHEDDPDRCLHAVLEMKARLADLNADRDAADALQIRQRFGVTQGLTFAGQVGSAKRREYTVMGDDVNLSARLMSSAAPGQILIAPSVYEDVADKFQLGPLPPVRVKGKSRPIQVYQVEGLRSDNRLLRRIERHGPLIGQAEPLAQGRAVLRRALAGRGAVLALEGVAGIGKSRLADALAEEAIARGARGWLVACASYEAHTPYAPWIAWLRALAHIQVDEGNPDAEKLRHVLARLHLDQERAVAPLYELLGLPVPRHLAHPIRDPLPDRPAPPQGGGMFARLGQKLPSPEAPPGAGANVWQALQARQAARPQPAPDATTAPGRDGGMWDRLRTRVEERARVRYFAALARLLERLAQDAPVVLLLEDAQWIDPLSQAALGYLAERVAAWPVLILVARRPPTGGEGQPPLDVPTLSPAPLSREESRALAQSLLGEAHVLSRPLAATIYRQSGGNPLFIEEIVRWLRRRGEDAGERPDRDLRRGLRASNTLQELVLSRVDSLPHRQRTVVKHAAVVGDAFATEDLSPLLEKEQSSDALQTALRSLDAAQLTYPVDAGGQRHAFQQALIREFVYNSQPFATRRRLHRQIAGMLEARHAQDLLPYAEALAYHYEQATGWLPAARYRLLSGRKALQRAAYREATRAGRHALEVLAELPGDDVPALRLRALAHVLCGDGALHLGDVGGAAEAYGAAHALVEAAPPAVLARVEEAEAGAGRHLALRPASLLSKLALARVAHGGDAALPEAVELARRAEALATTPADRVLAAASLAWLGWRGGDPAAATWRARAVRRVEAALEGPAGVRALLHELAGAWLAARAAYLSLGDAGGAARASVGAGAEALQGGDVAATVAWFEQAVDLYAQAGDAAGLALAHLWRAEAHWRAGEHALARASLDAAQILGGADDPVLRAAYAVLAGREAVWPATGWQRYADACHVLLLCRVDVE